MKWRKKYDVNLEEIHKLNVNGYSLPELSKMYHMSRTALNNYLAKAGYEVRKHYRNMKITKRNAFSNLTVYKSTDAWKRALVRRHGHKCMVPNCNYDVILEAHHVVFRETGGIMSIANGILLCPNHHAEAHAGLLKCDLALLKQEELLESPDKDNQQSSYESNWLNPERVVEDSETNSRAKAVMETRASWSRRKTKEEILRNMI